MGAAGVGVAAVPFGVARLVLGLVLLLVLVWVLVWMVMLMLVLVRQRVRVCKSFGRCLAWTGR